MAPAPTLLFDAIERYYRLMRAEHPGERQAFAALQRWFESDDRCAPDAFERLCADYRIDPESIRRMLRRRRRTAGRA